MNVTLMERLDFQLFFYGFTNAIDALLHALWHFSYTLVIELTRHVAIHILTDFRDPFTQLAICHMPILKHFLFLLHFCNGFGRNRRPTKTLFIMDICTSIRELSDPLLHDFDVHTIHCGP